MTRDEAKAWLDAKLPELLNRFGESVSDVACDWKGDSMRFRFSVSRMFGFEGVLTVTDTSLNLDLPFPLLARGFEGTAKAEAERWLDRNLPRQRLPPSGDA